MKKILSVILILATICCCLISAPAAMAEAASGSTAKTKTFTISSHSYPNAYFVLSSSTGLANVAQHNWYGKYTGNGEEKTHGFYRVSVKGPGLDRSTVWAPSATTNKKGIDTCREMRIKLPNTGDYKVTVQPLSASAAAKYWRVDYIKNWVHHATWHVTICSGCR